MRKWIAGLIAALGIGGVALLPGDGVRAASAMVVRQAGDSSLVRVTWTQSNADTVRVSATYDGQTGTVAITGPTRSFERWVPCRTPAQTLSVTLTPVRGTTVGAPRTASVVIPACVVVVPPAPPSVDSVRVVVVAPGGPVIVPPPDTTPTPVPTGDFAVASHMPATGMRLWFDDDLDNMAQNEFPAPNSQLRWYARNQSAEWRVRDATTPYSDGALRVPFPGNHYGDGYGVGLIVREEGCWPRMYTVAMEKFEGSGGQLYKTHFNEEKTVFPRTIVCADNSFDNSGPDIAYVSRNNRIEIQLQNGLGSPRRYQNFPVWYTTEKWHKVEHYMQANTPGKQDGIWRMWIDGVLAADFSDILYSNNGRQVGFQGVRWESVRGGGRDNAPTPAGGQFRTYDRLAVYVSPTIR